MWHVACGNGNQHRNGNGSKSVAKSMGESECENLNCDGREKHVKGDCREAISDDDNQDGATEVTIIMIIMIKILIIIIILVIMILCALSIAVKRDIVESEINEGEEN